MKKTIWILNHYASGMYFAKGGRHYSFAKYLKREGYDPVVFGCNAKHNSQSESFLPLDGLWCERMEEEIGVPFVFVDGRAYQGNGKQRILNMVDFYRNVKKAAKEYAQLHGKPDVIYASSVHPLTLVAGLQLAKHYKVKCICEVRDLWPEAIFSYSEKIKPTSLLGNFLYLGEKWIYSKADALIFTQEGGADYIRSHRWDKESGGPIDMAKVHHINNGVDLEAFDQNLRQHWLEDEDLDDNKIFKVVYCGAIRRINNLGLIIDAAKLVSNPKIKFLIFGDGDELESLNRRIEKEGITNVMFKGWVEKCFIPSVVARADVNIVHWEMSSLVARVGESYNKAFEYFAAAKPVFYTIRPGYSIVERYNCGRLTEGFASEDIAGGIEKMASLDEDEIQIMSHNARLAAEAYDFKALTRELIKILNA